MSDTTFYMGLKLPEVGKTLSPEWGEQVNQAFRQIDEHNHTAGKGQFITPSGMAIDQNLDMNSFSFENVSYTNMLSKSALEDINNSIQVVNGDLYFKDGAGNEVRITASGAISTGALGTITGMTGAASVVYDDGDYTFTDESGDLATINAGSFNVDSAEIDGQVNGIINASPNSTGHGIVPIGSVVATFPNLTGAYTTSNIVSSDSNGWVLCQGQTINDPTSPLDGQVVPNLSDSRFLRGSTVAGATGGSETFALTAANIPSHRHTMSHTHSMNHTHQQFANTFSSSTLTGSNQPAQSYTTGTASAYQIQGTTLGATLGKTGGPSTQSTGGASTSYTGYYGSGTEVTHVPKYISVVYLMRIK